MNNKIYVKIKVFANNQKTAFRCIINRLFIRFVDCLSEPN